MNDERPYWQTSLEDELRASTKEAAYERAMGMIEINALSTSVPEHDRLTAICRVLDLLRQVHGRIYI